MVNKRRGLGRGLDALLSAAPSAATASSDDNSIVEDSQLKTLPVEWLQRGQYQPRKDMDPDALQELADSIKAQGVMQPIVVRQLADQQYEIIAGERRWRASQMAGLGEIPVVVKNVSDETAMALALIENIQREDLNPMEEAVGLARLLDEFGMTHQTVAQAVGKSRTTVTNLLRLNNLEPAVKTLLEHGDLDMGHARTLLALENAAQVDAARLVAGKGLSVRETEKLVKKLLAEPKSPTSSEKSLDPNIRDLQDQLSQRLGAQVSIQDGGRGKGKLVIQYNTLDELDGILSHIQ